MRREPGLRFRLVRCLPHLVRFFGVIKDICLWCVCKALMGQTSEWIRSYRQSSDRGSLVVSPLFIGWNPIGLSLQAWGVVGCLPSDELSIAHRDGFWLLDRLRWEISLHSVVIAY